MSIWKVPLTLARINERNQNTMVDLLGIEFIEIGDDYLTATMPITAKVKQPIGIMHGGASCVLAETVGSNAANFAVDQEKFYCVGLDINTNHIRSITDGHVVARAEPFHLGRTTHVWGINIMDEHQKMISVNRLTMAVLARK
jgi:1,4-dihydroxy-2-naphthoyl-CoA hydrolase